MKLHGCDTKNCFTGKKRIAVTAAFLLLLAVQLAVLIYYGGRKSGFHEDEFYSYYSTNKTAGLFVNDRQWVERDDFRNDFVVLAGERFRYGIVKQMQSWDVHPPFYYYVLHTVCSLFPGVFDKWLGIAVNLLAYVPCFFLLAGIVYRCAAGDAYRSVGGNVDRDGKDVSGAGGGKCRWAVFLSFAVCAAWGFSAAVISGVMFIRMYQWLTLFVLLCAFLHVRATERREFGARFLLPLIPTVFLGFMTQYYYIIFHFFMGVGMCFLFLRKRRIKELFLYGASCGAGLLLAILYYPSSLSHIFRGYRGTEAVSEFGNAGNTMERLRFFAGLFNDYVMNGTLAYWLLLICLLWVTAGYAAKRRRGGSAAANAAGPSKQGAQTAAAGSGKTGETGWQAAGLLLFACAGYFFTVSKTALLLGETSNRYQLPINGCASVGEGFGVEKSRGGKAGRKRRRLWQDGPGGGPAAAFCPGSWRRVLSQGREGLFPLRAGAARHGICEGKCGRPGGGLLQRGVPGQCVEALGRADGVSQVLPGQPGQSGADHG